MTQAPDNSAGMFSENMNNAHYFAATYPHLRWSDDAGYADGEFERWLTSLDNLFSAEELNLAAGMPKEGSLPARMASDAFWAGENNHVDTAAAQTTAVQRHYIEHHVTMGGFNLFEDDLRVWARVLYAARNDASSARDFLLLFLQQNLGCLKALFILGQDANRNVAVNAEAIDACLNAPVNRALIARPQFSVWVLDNWLPRQLQQYHRRSDASTAPCSTTETDAAAI